MNQNLIERFAELPENLAGHLTLTVNALAAGVIISVPLAVGLVQWKRLRFPMLTVAGVIQTIPSLALLALMVPLLANTNGLGMGWESFGYHPAVIALTLYSILPIMRNTVTGILGVDPAMTEAARAMGMTRLQVLFKVELPLAAPVIIAGIRTATVWVVGTATLATPVGQRCLGNYIFAGLQTRNWTMVMFGVVSAAGLAVVLDLLIGGLQRSFETRRRPLGVACLLGLAAAFAGGMFLPALVGDGGSLPVASKSSEIDGKTEPDKPVEPVRSDRIVRIGSKTFSEQYILAALIDRTLQESGHRTQRVESLGSTIVFDALVNGDIDVYVDYSGTIWANYMKRTESDSPWNVLAQVSGWLAKEHGIRCLGSLGFENAYALAMRGTQARELGIRTIADLAKHAPSMKIGGDYEFFSRPEWTQTRDSYGLRFADEVSFDSTFMYEAVARGQVDVISAFSSDGRISAFDLAVLTDPKQVLPPYDAVLLLGPTIARGGEAAALKPLIDAIPLEDMQRANHMVDRDEDKKTADETAQWLKGRISSRGG